MNLNSGVSWSGNPKLNYTTTLIVVCGDNDGYKVEQVNFNDNATLWIQGRSKYGCPVLEMNMIWTALEDNALILGMVIFAAGIL